MPKDWDFPNQVEKRPITVTEKSAQTKRNTIVIETTLPSERRRSNIGGTHGEQN